MGKVSKPLTIVVFSPLDEWPEIVKLGEQGHLVIDIPGYAIQYEESVESFANLLSGADIVFGPQCWYMTELHRKHLTQAIKQARLRRYGTIAKKHKKGDADEKDTNLDTDLESAN
ncbi:hypothetical protein LCGC14_2424920 [marine sediment metagenome]|uniref:Uncharacterized protein n=1 Tax=marine sediment metagenome TaxID=412755 RepID=A0A0F9EHQ7_9ZZZZ